jgi:hypothetical protein
MQPNENIANAIRSTVTERGPEKSTCPSEIARMLFPKHWRAHMKEIVEVAIALQKSGEIAITQKGMPIDICNFKGPIRFKLPVSF